jgi:hypothetical protein
VLSTIVSRSDDMPNAAILSIADINDATSHRCWAYLSHGIRW